MENAISYATEVNIEGEVITSDSGEVILQQLQQQQMEQEPQQVKDENQQQENEPQQQIKQQDEDKSVAMDTDEDAAALPVVTNQPPDVEQQAVMEDKSTEQVVTRTVDSKQDIPSTPPAEQLVTSKPTNIITVQPETSNAETFPSGSKMDLLASASEMVQRQDVTSSNSNKTELILDPTTGELLVEGKCEGEEVKETKVEEGKEEVERRSKRIAKRKEVIQTFVSTARKKFKKENETNTPSGKQTQRSSKDREKSKENDQDTPEKQSQEDTGKAADHSRENKLDKSIQENDKNSTQKASTANDHKQQELLQVVRLKADDTEEENEKNESEDKKGENTESERMKALRSHIRVVKPVEHAGLQTVVYERECDLVI